MSSRVLIAALALAACAALPARASAPTPAQPLLYDGDESAAYAEGARGALFNPAGVGLRYPSEWFVGWAHAEDGGSRQQGVLAWRGLALHGERVKDVANRLGFTLAGGGEPLRVGIASSWLNDPGTHETVLDQRLGLLSRPQPWLSLGTSADHLLQPRFQGRTLQRVWTLAGGVRPLAFHPGGRGDWDTRLTLTGDVLLPEGGEAGQARVRIGAEVEAMRGLALCGSVEDHGGYHLGIVLRGVRASAGYQSAGTNDGHLYESYSVSIHEGEERASFTNRADERVAMVRLAGALGDEALPGFSLLGGAGATPVKPVHDALERALEDPLTRGVFLDLGGVTNMAQLEELRPRIRRLRAAGKPVLAFMEYGGGRGDFYLAGACNRIVMSPEAGPAGLGLRVERRYYRALLASWGVRMERSSYGRYKSAYRNFSVDSTSDADREVIEHNLDVSQGLLVSTLSTDRGVDPARLTTMLDGRPWRAQDFVSAGVIDSTGYREDALRMLGRLCGLGDRPRTVRLGRTPAARREWTRRAPVAVVYASGGIETGRSGSDLLMGPMMGSETVIRQLERAFQRRGVKAVVLRVESPGGSALASDLIRHAEMRLKTETKKPLIVSMGGLAGSGGYYISSAADRIYCDRFTRTASIGVLTVKPSFEGWYARHNVRQDDFDRGAWQRGWSTNRDWTAADQAVADSATLRFYHQFVSLVAHDRGLPWEQVDEVAQGRVWLGDDALERRLVDQIGGLEEAVAEARRRAGVHEGERIRLAEYRRPRGGLLQRLVSRQVGTALDGFARLPEPGSMLYWTDEEEAP